MLPMRKSSNAALQAPLIGLGVIIFDSLLRREWVKEDELAADLKIHPRILRKALRWFEQVSQQIPCLHAVAVQAVSVHMKTIS